MGRVTSKKKYPPDYRAIIYPGFLHIPDVLADEEDFISLTGSALRLLIDIARQYNGMNNGDLCASMSLMRKRGWSSNNLLDRAKKELIAKKFIELTKQGGLGMGPDLYAITWQPINECGGKLDVKATTKPSRALRRL